MSVINSSTRNMLMVSAVMLSLLQSPQTQARDDEWVSRCHKEYRERTAPASSHNETVVALESYLACAWVFQAGDGGVSGPVYNGGVNVGPGISARQDVSDKSCRVLSADIARLEQKRTILTHNHHALDVALKNSFEVADRARMENRAAQQTAAEDKIDCDRLRALDEVHRIVVANQRCKNRGLRREAFMDCVDLAAADITNTPYTTSIGEVCYVKAAGSRELAERARNAERDADSLATNLFNQRSRVARERARTNAELKRYEAEKKFRCP